MTQCTLRKLDTVCMRVRESCEIRTHKYFRVAVPAATTGSALVAALAAILKADPDDAAHLGSLLLHHGYLFPVIDTALTTVKDDSTLYRIQRPYFWPSHASSTDNVEYAIYLSRRLLRSEAKHGLDVAEAETYRRLGHLLGHIWHFIETQAELQLKLHKERRKPDKVVLDSEERAFWRLRKPGQPNALELDHRLSVRTRRRPTAAHMRAAVERLRQALKTKPWLKAMKASETMVTWVDQLTEYDPMLTAPQPSNPWISDDSTLWQLSTDTVEVPTERRVRRWGLSVHELVKDPIGRQVLETFLDTEFSAENIRFWTAIQDLKYAPNSQIEAKAEHIRDEFLAQGAPSQVNISSRTLELTLEALVQKGSKRHAFSTAEEHVFTLMSKDSYPRFLSSHIYKGVLSAAQQQGGRRLGWRNFVFAMASGGPRKSALPSSTSATGAAGPGGGNAPSISGASMSTVQNSSQAVGAGAAIKRDGPSGTNSSTIGPPGGPVGPKLSTGAMEASSKNVRHAPAGKSPNSAENSND